MGSHLYSFVCFVVNYNQLLDVLSLQLTKIIIESQHKIIQIPYIISTQNNTDTLYDLNTK